MALTERVLAGDRASLARAITLVESEHPKHRGPARELLSALLPHTGGARRIGISGVPGAGKSTLIDALGASLVEAGNQVAVLAVDPSSTVSGGSILGDKTRMAKLARDERAFVRPSPTGGTLGGVARKTREAMLVCEAAGFDVVFVETVGVGQSETSVADLVDLYALVLIAGAGDRLQGIKRGVLEVADLVVVNKADGDNRLRAEAAAREYATALRLMRGKRAPEVLPVSAHDGSGLEVLWETLDGKWREAEASGALTSRRRTQDVAWMWRLAEAPVLSALRRQQATRAHALEDAVRAGSKPAAAAADEILRGFRWPEEE